MARGTTAEEAHALSSPTTLNELFFDSMERYADRPVAMRAKVDGRWVERSFAEFRRQVEATSRALAELGITPGSHVAILSENRPEWAITDYACLTACCADVPVYPTVPSRQVEYILNDSGAVAAFVSDAEQLAKVLEIRDRLPALRHVIAFDPGLAQDGVLSLAGLIERNISRDPSPKWKKQALSVTPDELATLIYTSGTTGNPKGVMLTHGNLTSNVVSGLEALDLQEADECLSFLPLSHVFERMAGHYCMLAAGVVVNYAERIDTVSADMLERRPTVMLAVPRLYEKIYARILDAALSGSALKRRIFFWAKRTAERWVQLTLGGEPTSSSLAVKKAVADRLVFSKLRARTGGRIRFFVSGGAPLSADIARFFHAAGLPILEGYGLTETSPVIAVNTFRHTRLGTVGRPIEGVEVRIGPDGEVLTRGPNVMRGYYHMPEATAEVLESDGWFHTGDIGELDPDGYLKITDRKKDLIVTSGGKNIAPQPIENLLKTNRFVLNAVMLGDGRKYPIMLVVPEFDTLTVWAAKQGIQVGDHESLVALTEVGDKMEGEVKKSLRDLAKFEVPKKLLLVTEDFTVENGLLTPTLKVKRRAVEQRHAEGIEALYAEPPGGEHDIPTE
ncbi:MAG: long-chain fatty acid--CoA ligase [Gemmatimonadales bacterium]|nr:long-chain fatty acid--CoA ligase [Gemmatimonadales bacterium]